jgi:hypothetical protein
VRVISLEHPVNLRRDQVLDLLRSTARCLTVAAVAPFASGMTGCRRNKSL